MRGRRGVLAIATDKGQMGRVWGVPRAGVRKGASRHFILHSMARGYRRFGIAILDSIL